MATLNLANAKILGTGTYGKVYQLDHARAVKVSGAPYQRSLIREAGLLSNLQHPNIANIDKLTISANEVQLILPLADMDLNMLLLVRPPLLLPLKVDIFTQLLLAVSYLHTRGVLHGDIKPENCLMTMVSTVTDDYWQLKLSDFGIGVVSMTLTEKYSDIFTLGYRAPEILLHGYYTSWSDSWACGCVFYQMIVGQKLFPTVTVDDQLQEIFTALGSPAAETWPAALFLSGWDSKYSGKVAKILPERFPGLFPEEANIIDCCCKLNPSQRFLPRDLLHHPYFERSLQKQAPTMPTLAESEDLMLMRWELAAIAGVFPFDNRILAGCRNYLIGKASEVNMDVFRREKAWTIFITILKSLDKTYIPDDLQLMQTVKTVVECTQRVGSPMPFLPQNPVLFQFVLDVIRNNIYCTSAYDYLQYYSTSYIMADAEIYYQLLLYVPEVYQESWRTIGMLAVACCRDPWTTSLPQAVVKGSVEYLKRLPDILKDVDFRVVNFTREKAEKLIAIP